jgi:hypothetical protein
MCDQMPPKGSHDTPADMPRPMVTVENLRRTPQLLAPARPGVDGECLG